MWECRRCTTETPGYIRWVKLHLAFGEIQILGCFGNVAVNPRVCSRGIQGPSLGIDVWARWPVAGHLASLYILLVVFSVFSVVKSRAGLCGFDAYLTSLYILHVLFFNVFHCKESSQSVRLRWLLGKSIHITCTIL